MSRKEIRIMRVPEGGSHLPTEVLDNAKMKLSSVLINQRPHRVDTKLEEKYLPDIVGVSKDHPNFADAARRFWAELTIPIPSDGQLLDIGTRSGNPSNVMDLIKYKWAKDHPLVADTKQEAQANPRKRFWIYDPEREVQKENVDVQARKSAYKEFIKLAEDENRMDMMIRVLTGQDPSGLNFEEKENLLDKQVNQQPKKFEKIAKDKDLEIRAKVKDCLEYEIIRKVGNQYMYGDETIGSSEQEVVAWWKNKRNSSEVATIKARLQEFE